MNIQRWTTTSIEPSENGGFVAYADYLALLRQSAQGADARPVAIYQKAVDANLGIWKDITQGLYNGIGRDHRRIVYATRDAAPIVRQEKMK
jgi:hypothetical protein